MPHFNSILAEIELVSQNGGNNPFDTVRHRYISALHRHTNRNIICYYSAFLTAPNGASSLSIDDMDKNGLMNAVSEMDCNLGLDLILHTPGGSITAAESLVYYLTQKFGSNIRAIIPQMAMSAGTMLACACKQIYMGNQSSLGPFDPLVRGVSAFSVFDEFRRAGDDIKKFPHMIPLWQSMLQKYPPAFLEECERAIQLARQLVPEWLRNAMFKDLPQQEADHFIQTVMTTLNNPSETKEHSRHIHFDKAKSIGLNVSSLEEDQLLQECVLNVHHCYIASLSATKTAKIIENHRGATFVLTLGS